MLTPSGLIMKLHAVTSLKLREYTPTAVQSLFNIFYCDNNNHSLPKAVADVHKCAHLSSRPLPQFLNTKVMLLIHHRLYNVWFGTFLL